MRLEEEGWGHELRTYPRFYNDLEYQPGVKVSKALTDKGMSVHPRIHAHCDQSTISRMGENQGPFALVPHGGEGNATRRRTPG